MAQAAQDKSTKASNRFIIKILLFSGLILGAFLLSNHWVATRKKPVRKKQQAKAVVVSTTPAKKSTQAMQITAMGTVIPARQVTVFPEATGRIIYQNPNLVPGGRFKAGEILVKIDPRDYDLAIGQHQAAVSQAKLNLARERSLKKVAEKEWNLIRHEVKPTKEGRRLALREIQLENAKVALQSAVSSLEKAQLMRSRTVIRAPFNAIVVEEFVDVGQFVSNATRVASLVDSDRFWVRASVPTDRLAWIRVPGKKHDTGSPAVVEHRVSKTLLIQRPGHVVRLLGDLDPVGKMARLLIVVKQPLESLLQSQTTRTPIPLLLGSFVTVHIQGPKLENVLQIPRMALRDQTKVWVINQQGKLEIRQVSQVWSKDEIVYVSGNLHANEHVITSRISTPVAGMALAANEYRPLGSDQAKDPTRPSNPQISKRDGPNGDKEL